MFLTYLNKTYKPTPTPITLSQTQEVKQLVGFVDNAASLVKTKGEKALADFKQKDSEWWKGDNYIFAYDLTGKTLALPPQPEIEGKNRLTTADVNGKYYVKDMIGILEKQESGWYVYTYLQPNEKKEAMKLSYFKKVKMGNKTILVGSGIYLK